MPQDAEWKILAQKAAQEQDPAKLLQIVLSLVAAIDEEQSKKAHHFQKEIQPSTSAPAA